jgi:hypothetical protein
MIPTTDHHTLFRVSREKGHVIGMQKTPFKKGKNYEEDFWYYWKKEKDNSVDDWY